MIPSNGCHLRITAAAGTELAVASSRAFVKQDDVSTLPFITRVRGLQPEGLHPSRGVAPSGLRPLRKILDCSLPQESGQCLSPSVTGQPLSPATRHCLGEPLPHQLADGA